MANDIVTLTSSGSSHLPITGVTTMHMVLTLALCSLKQMEMLSWAASIGVR